MWTGILPFSLPLFLLSEHLERSRFFYMFPARMFSFISGSKKWSPMAMDWNL